MATYTSMLSS
jgi:hypothetical protein